MSDWRPSAACRRTNTETFFPASGRPDAYADAKAVCAWCPVTAKCGDAALVEEAGVGEGYRHGYRGGMTPQQRFELDPPVRRCDECGDVITNPHHNRRLCSDDCSRERRTRQSAESKVRMAKHITVDDPRHGTLAGYQAHQKAHQKACGPCGAKQSDYMKSWRAERVSA